MHIPFCCGLVVFCKVFDVVLHLFDLNLRSLLGDSGRNEFIFRWFVNFKTLTELFLKVPLVTAFVVPF
jgi:hypothetical protein